MPQVDVLLGILAIKPNVLCCLMQVGQVQHTCVSIGDVEAAQVAHIPIGIAFDNIQIWGMYIDLHPWGHARGARGHSISTGRTVSSFHCRGVWYGGGPPESPP